MKFYISSTVYGDGEDMLAKYSWLKDFGYEDRHIVVNTLEELMDLLNKIKRTDGICLFPNHEIYDGKSHKWVATGIPEIEIYDGYRE